MILYLICNVNSIDYNEKSLSDELLVNKVVKLFLQIWFCLFSDRLRVYKHSSRRLPWDNSPKSHWYSKPEGDKRFTSPLISWLGLVEGWYLQKRFPSWILPTVCEKWNQQLYLIYLRLFCFELHVTFQRHKHKWSDRDHNSVRFWGLCSKYILSLCWNKD